MAYALQVSEMPLTAYTEIEIGGANDFSYFSNAIWCVILTISTVGYGDIYPKTDIGRFIVIFICI